MKINFNPILYRDFTGIGSAIQGVAGLGQAIFGGIREHKAERDLQKLANSYQPNQSIANYYSKALNRYNANPYTSPLYNAQSQNIQRSTAQGLQGFQDRRSANAGISTLVQNQNDALLKAAATAEGQKGQELAQLEQATAMKAKEDKYPFELKYNLLAQKAGGGAQILNAGLSNIFGAGSSLSQMNMLKNMYGNQGGGAAGGNSIMNYGTQGARNTGWTPKNRYDQPDF